ncbi:lysophosphatidic acid receptor 6-like [Scomber scombrus]|uniref:Lysophosphatidic acid receptor 6-like n=2 Tax=Scomber scombrus TaxID=13677 RepID=A0AAV1P207_SCOSC
MACIWITMLFINNVRSSSIFITFIGIDRLLAVVYPLRTRHLRTTSNAWKSSVLIWTSVVMVNIPESFGFKRYLDSGKDDTCFEFYRKSGQSLTGLVYLQPVLVCTLLAVNIVTTALVSWTLRRHLTDSAKVNKKMNVMLIFAMNLIMFIIFFLPVSLVVISEDWRPFFMPLSCLASVNCCLDPLLYYFSLDGFWKKKEEIDTSQGQVALNSYDLN